jgi:O-antigen/teichoic acid export membrane protein
MSVSALKKTFIIEIASIRVLTVIFQLVFLKAYTHYTSLYELGIYYFLFTIAYALNAFLLVPLDYFQQSKLYKLKSESASLKSFYLINAWVLKFALCLLIVSDIICYFINPKVCLVIALLTFLSLSIYFVNLLRGFINNLENRRYASYTLLIETICKILFFLLYNYLFGSSALVILSAMLSASLLSFVILFIFLTSLPEFKLPQINYFIPKEIIAFSYPMSIGAVINWIQLQSYSLILVPLGFVESVGIFGTMANVGSSGMNACSTIFAQLYVPNIYKSNGTYIKKYLRMALLAIAFVFTVSALSSKIIIGLVTKHELVKYSLLILFGILTEAGNFIISGLSVYVTIHNLTKTTLKLSLMGVLVFFLSFIMLYAFKYINVYTLGIPMVITQLIICLGLYAIVHKKIKIK